MDGKNSQTTTKVKSLTGIGTVRKQALVDISEGFGDESVVAQTGLEHQLGTIQQVFKKLFLSRYRGRSLSWFHDRFLV